jgi:hypothetical protein
MALNITENIKLLKEICKENNLKIKDDIILDLAVKIAVSDKISAEKKVYQPYNKQQPEQKASESQIKFLSQLGYEGNIDITKQQADEIIKELVRVRDRKK